MHVVRRASSIAIAIAIALAFAFPLSTSVVAHGRVEGPHCAYELRAVGRHGHVIEARLAPLGCFRTLRESMSAGTPRGSVMIGTEFDHAGFDGESVSFFASSACNGVTWEVASMPTGWNDKAQSGKGFGGCDHNKKFAGANFAGDVVTCTPNCSGYGVLANEVSSLRWKP